METWAVASTPKPADAPPRGKAVPLADASTGRSKRRRGDNGRGSDDDVRQLCVQTARLALSTDRQVRQLQGMVVTTALVPEFTGVQQAAQEFEKKAEDAWAKAWAMLLMDVSQRPAVAADCRQRLQAHCTAMITVELLTPLLRHFYVAPTYDNHIVFKVQYMMTAGAEPQMLATDLSAALVALGATLKHGQPPRTAAARAVQRALASV